MPIYFPSKYEHGARNRKRVEKYVGNGIESFEFN